MTACPPDDVLLDGLQRSAFDYFLRAYNPRNGLVADTTYFLDSLNKFSNSKFKLFPLKSAQYWTSPDIRIISIGDFQRSNCN